MIEWLSNALDMRFYYWTGLSWLILLPTYIIGAGLITLLWWWLAKRIKRSWVAIVPLFALLAIGPWIEELWIAWNFGHLCKKDAGIFVYKTVEVEGFYDATAGLLQIQKPLPAVTSASFDERGFRFYEMSLADTKGGPSKVAHFEKVGGEWVGKVIDHPTARYHYRWPHMNTPMSHKVDKIERTVVDNEQQEVLARETKYRREAPWFYVGLDRPAMLCPAPGEHPLSKHGSVFNLALTPIKSQ